MPQHEIRVDVNKPAKPIDLTQLDKALLSQDVIDKSEMIVPVHIEEHPERIIEAPDGRVFHDWKLTFKRAHVEAFRQGYACLNCWVWQSEPFPWKCRHCAFEMKKLQAERFANEFAGVTWVGPRTKLDEEQERLADWVKEDKLAEHERIAAVHIPAEKTIWLP